MYNPSIFFAKPRLTPSSMAAGKVSAVAVMSKRPQIVLPPVKAKETRLETIEKMWGNHRKP